MTVKELIEKLQEFPENLDVMYEDSYYLNLPVQNVRLGSKKWYGNDNPAVILSDAN